MFFPTHFTRLRVEFQALEGLDWSRLVLALTAWALQVSLGLRYLNFGGSKDVSFFRTWFPDLGDGL